MTKPLLILGNGVPSHLDDAPIGSVYIDGTNLPSGGGNDSKSYPWGSVSYGGPVTNGAAPTGGVSLSAQMQINGAPEYVIQGAFDNTISSTKNAKWQGTFFGNVPAYQASNPNANPAYAIAVQESASLGEKFPELRIKGMNPSMMSPNGIGDTAKGLDQSDDLGRLVRSRNFDNFNNVGTQSYEIGEITYKPQPDGGRDFISGSSGAPAVSFRQISWQGAYQIGGKWVDVLPARYSIMNYWGDGGQRVIKAFTMGGANDGGAIVRYCSTPGTDQNCDSWATLPVYGRSWRNASDTWLQVNDWQNGTTPIFSGGGVNATNSLVRNFMRKSNASGNVTGATEAVYSIYGGADNGGYVELVLGANGKMIWNRKELTISTTDKLRLLKIAETGQFPDFVNAYLHKHLASIQRIDLSETTSQLERLQKQYDDLEKRLAMLEGVPK